VFRGLGAAGVAPLGSWRESACFALALMFIFTGMSHFTRMRHDMARMVPSIFPARMGMVYFTGVCELLGAIGLIVPRTRMAASLALIVMLLALFPANVKAARDRLTLRGRPATALWLRTPMQLLFIGMLWWVSGVR
jgi:uncharacterized membrane protein